jgi:hypothetical protein
MNPYQEVLSITKEVMIRVVPPFIAKVLRLFFPTFWNHFCNILFVFAVPEF